VSTSAEETPPSRTKRAAAVCATSSRDGASPVIAVATAAAARAPLKSSRAWATTDSVIAVPNS